MPMVSTNVTLSSSGVATCRPHGRLLRAGGADRLQREEGARCELERDREDRRGQRVAVPVVREFDPQFEGFYGVIRRIPDSIRKASQRRLVGHPPFLIGRGRRFRISTKRRRRRWTTDPFSIA